MQTKATRGPAVSPLELLYRSEYGPMVRLAFSLVHSNAVAEEIVQEAFVSIAHHLGELDHAGAYLRTTVVRGCYAELRKRKLRLREAGGLEASPQNTSSYDDDDQLLRSLKRLPAEQKVVVVLKYYRGFNATEIGHELNMRPSTVRSHLRRALKAMRAEVRR